MQFHTADLTSSFCSVPISRLPELVYETKKDIKESGLVSTIVGHVGDGTSLNVVFLSVLPILGSFPGNFHALLLSKTEEDLDRIRECVHRMVRRAIALDGTCERRGFIDNR